MLSFQVLVTLFAALATTVHGHGAMVAVTGANGITAMGMGVDPSTPRDGTRRRPFQQDSSIIRDEEIQSGEAGPCGRTLAGGNNNVAASVEAASSSGLPSMSENGQITMTIHQVNGDGAGPYTCEMSTDATGTDFVPLTIIQNVPGENSRSRARATPFPLTVQAAAGTQCTGGPNGDACIIRCRNAARAGPFGGCAVVTGPLSATPPAAAVPPVAEAPVAAPVASSVPVGAPVASSVPVAAPSVPVAAPSVPVAAPSVPVAAPSVPVAAPSVPVAEPVASSVPVAAPVPSTPATGDRTAAEQEEAAEDDAPAATPQVPAANGLIGALTSLIPKRDLSRKRMLNSRVVKEEKRGRWI